jgi:O-antigen ligase
LVNIFGIGEEMYKGGLKTGYFSLNGLYIPCFSLIFLLFNFKFIETKNKRIITAIFAFTTFLIFVALLKRTLLLLVIAALIIYIIKYAQIKKVILNIIVVSLVFLMVPFFQDNLLKSLESRNSRFNEDYNVTNEGRFTENIIMFGIMSKKPIQLLVGSGEVFNDRKYISKFYEVEREAHNSFIRIFWNGGLIGLLLFLFFYFIQFKTLFYDYKFIKNKIVKRLIFFALLLIGLRFFNDFSSGITYLSFNAFCYLFIGGVIQISINQKKSERLNIIK